MKRTALAGIFTLAAGAFALLLAASIFYSCRSGGSPHSYPPSGSLNLPVEDSAQASEYVADGRRIPAATLTDRTS